MKEVLQKLLRTLSNNIPEIPFKVRFWDGESQRFGSGEPAFSIIFKQQKATKSVFSKGSIRFCGGLFAGNIDIEGDFCQLIRLGIDPRFQDLELSLRTKAGILFHHLAPMNTLQGSPRNIAHHYDLGNDFYKLCLIEYGWYAYTETVGEAHNLSSGIKN
jgi:cyclopropane-fatty-acyl-phospholipid synthase